MTRSQIEELMEQTDAENQRREAAKDQLMTTLGEEGIAPGSKEYSAIQQYYADALKDGKVTHHILLSDAGIRTLVAMSGVGGTTDAGPGSGLHRTTPAEYAIGGGGEAQLNKAGARANTRDEKMREAMARNLRR